MKLTAEIEEAILDALADHPERALVLPEWAYWKGRDQPVIYREGLPVTLVRYLYEKVIGPLDYGTALIPREGTPARNINPHLCIATPGRRRGEVCPNGHPYAGNELHERNAMGYRCATCYAEWKQRHTLGRPNMGQRNAAKTQCPRGHAYSGDNLMILRNGRRRCRTCNREQSREYAARRAA